MNPNERLKRLENVRRPDSHYTEMPGYHDVRLPDQQWEMGFPEGWMDEVELTGAIEEQVEHIKRIKSRRTRAVQALSIIELANPRLSPLTNYIKEAVMPRKALKERILSLNSTKEGAVWAVVAVIAGVFGWNADLIAGATDALIAAGVAGVAAYYAVKDVFVRED
jgi:hypothetical protein